MKSIHTPIRDIIPPHIRAQVEAHRLRYESDQAYRDECDAEKAASDAAWEATLRAERAGAMTVVAKERLETSGIPKRVCPFLSEHKETEALRAALSLGVDGRIVMLLGGGVGVGKTIAACIAAWQVPGSVRFVRAIDLVRHGAFDPEYWDDLADCAALVLDELGGEPLDERGWALSCILDLIVKRYDSGKRTWITLNLPIEPFFARYGTDGERLRDKLRECGRYVEVKGKSLRGGK